MSLTMNISKKESQTNVASTIGLRHGTKVAAAQMTVLVAMRSLRAEVTLEHP